jgi:tRNA1(Val) A37 N6-methylase TrmN6
METADTGQTLPEASPFSLLDGRVALYQPRRGYRVAIDAPLLAAAIKMPKGGRLLDIGCATGAVLYCAAARLGAGEFIGLERQPELAHMARHGKLIPPATANDTIKINIIVGDIAQPPFLSDRFDHITTNPPYYSAADYRPTQNSQRAVAYGEIIPLGLWFGVALKLLRSSGMLSTIIPPHRLSDLLAAITPLCGAISLYPLWPREGQPARRIIVRAIKGSRAPLRLLPGLILHRGAGADYSAGALEILRGAAALSL